MQAMEVEQILKNIKCAELAILASLPAMKLLGGISRSV